MLPSGKPRFAPRQPRKGKPKTPPGAKGSEAYLSRAAPIAYPPPPLPKILFPNYNPLNSTPLPPPSMPKKRFLRRILPLIVAGAVGAYFLRRPSEKQLTDKSEEAAVQVSSIPVDITSQETMA